MKWISHKVIIVLYAKQILRDHLKIQKKKNKNQHFRHLRPDTVTIFLPIMNSINV